MAQSPASAAPKSTVRIETLSHEGATRKNIPAAEYHAALRGLTNIRHHQQHRMM